MLVSHRKHFIYTKTVKTGGTSVEAYFEPYCMPEGEWSFAHERDEYASEAGIIGCRGIDKQGKTWFNHMSAQRIKRRLGDPIWNDYFKFCVIRNPFDKLVSAFHFFEQRFQIEGKFPRTKRMVMTEAEFLNAIQGKTVEERFRLWIAAGGGVDDRNKYIIDGEICMDFFIRQERLAEDVEAVCDRLNLPFDPERIPRLKSGVRPGDRQLSDYYDAEAIAKVEQDYALELNLFHYASPALSGSVK